MNCPGPAGLWPCKLEFSHPGDHVRIPPQPGDRYGRLVVLSVDGPQTHSATLCRCDCGMEVKPRADALAKGRAKSCGCLSRELSTERFTKHGLIGTPEYESWRGMLDRCFNSRRHYWKYYGGRGITVCPQWREDFPAFLSDVGPRPGPGYSIDRFPNKDGNYEPGNVRWASRTQQMRNTSAARAVTFRGETLCVQEWAERLGCNATVLHARLYKLGWSVDRAMSTPFLGRVESHRIRQSRVERS